MADRADSGLIDADALFGAGDVPASGGLIDADSLFGKDRATMGQAFGRGVDQMQGMLYGGVEAIGEATGFDGVADFGKEGRARNELEAAQYPEAQNFTGIRSFGDAGQFVSDTLASQAPQVGVSIGGAAVGAGIGALGGPLAPVTVPLGAFLGAAVPNFLMGAGEVQSSIKQKDPDTVAPGYALGGGAAIAALDSILPGRMGTKLLGALGADVAGEVASHILTKRVATEAGKAAVTEGITEGLQEIIGEAAASKATGQQMDPNWWKNTIDAAAAGALVGGTMGAASGVASPKQQANDDADRPDSPRLTDEDRASPIPNDLIDDGKAMLDPASALYGDDPDQARTPRTAASVRATLLEAGETNESIDAMSVEELAATMDQARASNITPSPEAIQQAQSYVSQKMQAEQPVPVTPQSMRERFNSPEEVAKRATNRAEMVADQARVSVNDLPENTGNTARRMLDNYRFQQNQARRTNAPDPVAPASQQAPAAPQVPEGTARRMLDQYRTSPTALTPERRAANAALDALPAKPAQRQQAPILRDERGIVVTKQGKPKKPQSLIEFLASKGGIQDEKGEVSRGLGLSGKSGRVRFTGNLINPKGMTLQEAQRLAVQEGYITDPGAITAANMQMAPDGIDAGVSEVTINDLLTAIQEDNASGYTLFSELDRGQAEAWNAERQTETAQEMEASAVEQALDEVVARTGLDRNGDSAQDIARMMAAEDMSVDEAAERAAFMQDDEWNNPAPANVLGDIPFFEDTPNEIQRSAAPENRAGDGTRDVPRERPGPEGRAERSGEASPRGGETGTRERGQAEPAVRPAPEPRKVGSFALVDKSTGKAIAETVGGKWTGEAKRLSLNTNRYEAVPIQDYLADYNNRIKEDGGVEPAPRQAEPDTGPRPGKVGMMLSSGEVVLTATGRETTPFPKVLANTNRKAINALKRVDTWLMQNALDEARSRGDNFNARQFEQNLDKPSQSDKDSAEYYLFDDDFVQPVPRSILKPLVTPTAEPAVEPGADNLPQTVIPGAERISDRQQAERQAERPMRANRPQREAGGMFDEGNTARQLFDDPAPAKAKVDDDTPPFSKSDRPAKARDDGSFLLSEQTGPVTTNFELSPEAVDQAREISLAFRKELNRLGLGDIGLRVSERINAAFGGETFGVDGRYFRKMIDIALDAADPAKTLTHEALHAMKAMNLFSKQEWAILERKSRNQWMDKYTIADRYGSFPQDRQIEEGIAHAIADWSNGGKMDGIIAKSFRKIESFIEALGNALRGNGFQSANDVFAKAMSGEVGNRPRDAQGRFVSNEAAQFDLRQKAGEALAKVIDTQKAAAAVKKAGKTDRNTADDGESAKNLAKRKIIDYLNPVSEWMKGLGFKPSDMADPYLQARLAEDTALGRIRDAYDKYIDPVIDEIGKGAISLQDLHRYMYALHAQERNEVVGKRNPEDSDLFKAVTDPSKVGASGMPTNEANRIIREYDADPAKAGPLRRSAKLVRQMLDANLKAQSAAGLISQETYDLLSKQWKNYVPLKSEEGKADDGGWLPPSGKGFDVRGKDVKTALGRFSEADNIVLHSVQQTFRSMRRHGTNEVGKSVLRLLNKVDPAGEKYAEVYWSDDAPIGNIVKAEGLQKRTMGSDGKVKWAKQPFPINADDTLATKVGGKTYYIRFKDPKIGNAFKKMNDEQMNLAFKILGTVSNWQSIVNTRKNPAFTPINIIRDAWTAKILLSHFGFDKKESSEVVGNMPAAMGAMWRYTQKKSGKTESQKKWDGILKEWRASGGQITFDNYATIGDDLSTLEKQVIRAARNKTGKAKIGEVWRGLMDFIENVNDAGENGIRIAAYAKAREKGLTTQRAAFLGRDLTVDFKKRGELSREANALWVFFNSSTQGNYNVISRGLKTKDIQKAAAKFVMAGFVMSAMNSLLAGDDDDGENAYEKMLREQPYILERNVVFFIPGTARYIKFPLPFGFNAAYNIGVQGHAASTGNTDIIESIFSIVRVTMEAFNPIGSGSVANMISPTIADPFIDILANENFAGNPIYPTGNPYDRSPPPDSHQAFNRTNPAFKGIAEGANALTGGDDIKPGMVDIHPDTLEHLWSFLVGGVGRFLSQSGETIVRAGSGEFEPTKTPFARSFYGQPTEDSMKARYYNMREIVMTAMDHYEDYMGSGRTAQADEIKQKFGPELSVAGAFKSADSARRKINKARRYLESQPDTAANKAQLDQLDEQEAEIMLRVRQAYIKAKEAN